MPGHPNMSQLREFNKETSANLIFIGISYLIGNFITWSFKNELVSFQPLKYSFEQKFLFFLDHTNSIFYHFSILILGAALLLSICFLMFMLINFYYELKT